MLLSPRPSDRRTHGDSSGDRARPFSDDAGTIDGGGAAAYRRILSDLFNPVVSVGSRFEADEKKCGVIQQYMYKLNRGVNSVRGVEGEASKQEGARYAAARQEKKGKR